MNIPLDATPYYGAGQLHAVVEDASQPQDPGTVIDDRYLQAHIPLETSKRKSDDDNGTAPRSKRNRYISIACNECKRRKIKCNGLSPCLRCGNLSLECIYASNCCSSSFRDSEEYRTMSAQIQSLQQQIDHIYAHLSAMRAGHNEESVQALSPQMEQAGVYEEEQAVPTSAPDSKPDPPPPLSHVSPLEASEIRQASQDLAAQLLKATQQ